MDSDNTQNTQNEIYSNTGSGGPQTTPLEPNYIRRPYMPEHHEEAAIIHPQKQSKKQPLVLGLMVSGALVLGTVLGGAGAEAVMLATNANSNAVATAPTSTASNSEIATSGSSETVAQSNTITIGSVYQKVSPSVVRITSIVRSGNGRFAASGEATGTGIIIDTNGYIVTNNHVIDNGTSIKVEFSNGSEYDATVVGTAPQDDLAVIKVDAPSDLLVPATLGDSSTAQVGDEVIAIGYPYGLDQSVSSGIVSGLNRTDAGSTGSRSLNGLIQVDAAINPGNSGGPLLNSEGEVIGINTMIESPVEGFTGVGLAIPINQVKSLLSQLEQGGQVQRPWIGIAGLEISQDLQQEYNLPVSRGVLVMDVTANSPAAQAGLKASTISGIEGGTGQPGATSTTQIGDIIVAIDGQKVGAVSDLTSYLNNKQPGDKVTLTIVRDGQHQDLTLTLQAWPSGASDITN